MKHGMLMNNSLNCIAGGSWVFWFHLCEELRVIEWGGEVTLYPGWAKGAACSHAGLRWLLRVGT